MLLHITTHPFYALYAILLMITGVTALVMAFESGKKGILYRLLMVGWTLSFGGYGVYVGFVNTSGSYYISTWAIFVPCLLLAAQIMKIVKWIRGRGVQAAAPEQPVVLYGRPQSYAEPQPYRNLPQYGPQPPRQD